jgi:hypothetical protein
LKDPSVQSCLSQLENFSLVFLSLKKACLAGNVDISEYNAHLVSRSVSALYDLTIYAEQALGRRAVE